MSVQTIVILLLTGIAAGMLSGLVGVGGGIIIVPALVIFLQFSQKNAQGTSLGILLLPVGILAAWQYYKQGFVDVKIVGLVSSGFFAGGFLGSKLALMLPEAVVRKIFAVFLIVMAVKMLFFDNKKNPKNGTTSTSQERVDNTL